MYISFEVLELKTSLVSNILVWWVPDFAQSHHFILVNNWLNLREVVLWCLVVIRYKILYRVKSKKSLDFEHSPYNTSSKWGGSRVYQQSFSASFFFFFFFVLSTGPCRSNIRRKKQFSYCACSALGDAQSDQTWSLPPRKAAPLEKVHYDIVSPQCHLPVASQ